MAHIPEGYDLLTAYDKGKPVAIKMVPNLTAPTTPHLPVDLVRLIALGSC